MDKLFNNQELTLIEYDNQVKRLRGVFTFKDKKGFPLDMSFELAKENNWEVDWIEALADAARQCVLKYESLLQEISFLEPHKIKDIKTMFICGLMSCQGETFQHKAENMYKFIHRYEQNIQKSS